MASFLVLLCCVLVSPVWTKPVAESKMTNQQSVENVLNMIEETLGQVTSETQEEESLASVNPDLAVPTSGDESEWPWIDSFLQQYVETEAALVNVTELNVGMIPYVLQYYTMSEKFRDVIMNNFVTSKDFLNFTTQRYSHIKDTLLQWFVTVEDYRNSVLRDIECNEVSKLLKLFASSLPLADSVISSKQFVKDEPFAWDILEKWSENECFKSALLQNFLLSDPFRAQAKLCLSNSELFAKAVSQEFLCSQHFISTLMKEYTKSEKLLNTLLQQYETSQKFHEYLLKKFIQDQTYRQNVFDYLLPMDSKPNNVEFREIFLNQVVQNNHFRNAVFQQFLEVPEFKISALNEFASIEHFRYALVVLFAKSEDFSIQIADSPTMLNDAVRQFEESESFRHAVMIKIENIDQ